MQLHLLSHVSVSINMIRKGRIESRAGKHRCCCEDVEIMLSVDFINAGSTEKSYRVIQTLFCRSRIWELLEISSIFASVVSWCLWGLWFPQGTAQDKKLNNMPRLNVETAFPQLSSQPMQNPRFDGRTSGFPVTFPVIQLRLNESTC